MKYPIIILHGWARHLSGKSYEELKTILQKDEFKVYAPDFPGFGSEPLKNSSMNLDNYVEFVRDFVKDKKIIKPIIIGHSFGGRVALKYAWQYPYEVSKIILTGAPIIRHISVRGRIGYICAVIFGKVFSLFPKDIGSKVKKIVYFAIGEWDYYKAGPLKQIFTYVINEDLRQYAREVKAPIYLVWGALDKITPVSDVEEIKKLNPAVKSVIVENYGHKLPYEDSNLFVKSIQNFL